MHHRSDADPEVPAKLATANCVVVQNRSLDWCRETVLRLVGHIAGHLGYEDWMAI